MVVKLHESKIEWKVNSVMRASMSKNYLNDQTLCFVPFIELFNPGDSVEWLGCEYSSK